MRPLLSLAAPGRFSRGDFLLALFYRNRRDVLLCGTLIQNCNQNKKAPRPSPIFKPMASRHLYRAGYRAGQENDGEGGEITISAPRLLVCVPLHMKLVQCDPQGGEEVSRKLFPARGA